MEFTMWAGSVSDEALRLFSVCRDGGSNASTGACENPKTIGMRIRNIWTNGHRFTKISLSYATKGLISHLGISPTTKSGGTMDGYGWMTSLFSFIISMVFILFEAGSMILNWTAIS